MLYLALAIVCGLAAAASVTTINVSWFDRAPEGYRHSGFLQSDQNFYTSAAREVFERGNGFSYVMPNSLDRAAPAVHWQWPLTALAWAHAATGLSWPAVWEIWRLVWCAAFFAMAALVVRCFTQAAPGPVSSAWREPWAAMLWVLTGGGAAAILSLWHWPAHRAQFPDFIALFESVERAYHWWFLNLFRNVLYPLEATFHAFFFATVWALLAGRRLLFLALYAATLATGAFVGMEISTVILLYLGVEVALLKWRQRRRRAAVPSSPNDVISESALLPLFAACLAMTALFVAYYRVFVPILGGEEGRTLIHQFSNFPYEMIPAGSYFIAYFFALAGAGLGLLRRDVREWAFRSQAGRMIVCWAVAVFLLLHNHWFLRPHGLQPPHFSRGYLFFPLAVLAAVGVRAWWVRSLAQHFTRWPRWIPAAAMALGLLVLSADSILFFWKLAIRVPHPEALMIQEDTWDALQALDKITSPGEALNILNPDDKYIGVLIPVYTRHNSYLSDVIATPFYADRTADLHQWKINGRAAPLWDKHDIDLVMIQRRQWDASRWMAMLPEGAAIVWENRRWIAVQIKQPKALTP